jgi:hypothetical protein
MILIRTLADRTIIDASPADMFDSGRSATELNPIPLRIPQDAPDHLSNGICDTIRRIDDT